MTMLRNRMPRRLRAAALALVAAAATCVTPWTAGPSAAVDPAFCGQAATGPRYEWVAAGPGAWNHPANWTRNDAPAAQAPGYDETDALVCIPSDANVTLVHGGDDWPGAPYPFPTRGEAIVRTLDLAPGARLIIATSGRLYTSGTADERSLVRRAPGGTPARLMLRGTLGGIGEIAVDGVLQMDHLVGAPGSPTMTTRHCITFFHLACHSDAPPASMPVTSPGRTVVRPEGLLRVSGAGGVNLDDAREIDVSGRMDILGPGYVAADDGTSLTVRAGAVLRLTAAAAIYQGNPYFTAGRAVVALAGRVVRTGAEATSLIDAEVQLAPTARALVATGWLSLGGEAVPQGQVRYGATYGIGRCDNHNASCSAPIASSEDRQVVSVTLPSGPAGTVPVSLAEKPLEQTAGDVEAPVRIHVDGVTATPAQPMIFRFRLDAAAVGGRDPSSFVVKRRADGAATYATVPDCLGNGQPPVGSQSCVASRSAVGAGDVLILVRTQVSSRWKIR